VPVEQCPRKLHESATGPRVRHGALETFHIPSGARFEPVISDDATSRTAKINEGQPVALPRFLLRPSGDGENNGCR